MIKSLLFLFLTHLVCINATLAQDAIYSFGKELNFFKIKSIADSVFKDIDMNTIENENENERIKQFVEYKRWEWFYEKRINADGSFPDKKQQFEQYKKYNLGLNNKKLEVIHGKTLLLLLL